MSLAKLSRRPPRVLNQGVQLERVAAASLRPATVYDFASFATCPRVQLDRFDEAIGGLHDAIAVANHELYGDPLPRHAGSEDPSMILAAAARGTRGSGTTLPHFDRIQAAFGRHDIHGISAHVGAAAAEACEEMGARGYASGAAVAFRGAPDLHTAAHEAAHVVQQRAGVSLAGGVGAAGDVYERHADRVADLVVRGQSAEAALDEMAGRGGAGHRRASLQRAAVQRAPAWTNNLATRGLGEENKKALAEEQKKREAAEKSPVEAMRQVFAQIASVIQQKWAAAAAGAKASLSFKIPVTLPTAVPVTFTISVSLSIQKQTNGCSLSGSVALAATAGLKFLKTQFPSASLKVDASVSATGKSAGHAMQLVQLGVYNRLDPKLASWLLGADFGGRIELGAGHKVETKLAAGIGLEAKGLGGQVSAEVTTTSSQITDKDHRQPRATTSTAVVITGSAGGYTGQGSISKQGKELTFEATGTFDLSKVAGVQGAEARVGEATQRVRNGVQQFLRSGASRAQSVKALAPMAKAVATATSSLEKVTLGGNLSNFKTVKVAITLRRDKNGVVHGTIEVTLSASGTSISVGAGALAANIELTQDKTMTPIKWSAKT